MTILQVDDSVLDRSMFRDILANQRPVVGLVQVSTIEQARGQIDDKYFDLAIVDACVPGRRPNIMSLIQEMRQSGRVRRIVGVSGDENNLPILMAAGCDRAIDKVILVTGSTIGELIDWAIS